MFVLICSKPYRYVKHITLHWILLHAHFAASVWPDSVSLIAELAQCYLHKSNVKLLHNFQVVFVLVLCA